MSGCGDSLPISLIFEILNSFSEYTQWKYNDNFFQIGAIAMRYNEIPSIRIHIKFDVNAPAKAEELNMPLLFNRVFIEQCPTYRKYRKDCELCHRDSDLI